MRSATQRPSTLLTALHPPSSNFRAEEEKKKALPQPVKGCAFFPDNNAGRTAQFWSTTETAAVVLLPTMTLFILTETSAGYALLKAKDKKLLKRDDLATEAATPEGVSNLYVNLLFLKRIIQACRRDSRIELWRG